MLCRRFIRGRRRDRDLTEVVLMYQWVAFLRGKRITAEKRYGDTQNDPKANEFHDERSLLPTRSRESYPAWCREPADRIATMCPVGECFE